ncbi:MAG: hypothetical protein ACE37H_17520 [Phycisphaeraceae bacterium]
MPKGPLIQDPKTRTIIIACVMGALLALSLLGAWLITGAGL